MKRLLNLIMFIALLFTFLAFGGPAGADDQPSGYDNCVTVVDQPAMVKEHPEISHYETVYVPAVTHEETVVDEPAGWQRYSYNGPWESDTAPPFPGDNWQPNVKGDPHNVGVAGAYFQSHGNSGNGDWFYLEATAAVTHTEVVEDEPGHWKTHLVIEEHASTEYIVAVTHLECSDGNDDCDGQLAEGVSDDDCPEPEVENPPLPPSDVEPPSDDDSITIHSHHHQGHQQVETSSVQATVPVTHPTKAAAKAPAKVPTVVDAGLSAAQPADSFPWELLLIGGGLFLLLISAASRPVLARCRNRK